jgi:hypothetical protein
MALDLIAKSLGDEKTFLGELDRRLEDASETHRAVGFEERAIAFEVRGNGRRENALVQGLTGEERGARGRGSGPEEVQRLHLARFRDEDRGETVSSEARV